MTKIANATASEVREFGDTHTVVLSEVLMGGGFGFGGGGGTTFEAGPEPASGFGSGGGGGFGAQSRPIAVVSAGPGGLRIVPVIDVSKILLACMGAAGFLIFWLACFRNMSGGQPPRPRDAGRFFGRMVK